MKKKNKYLVGALPRPKFNVGADVVVTGAVNKDPGVLLSKLNDGAGCWACGCVPIVAFEAPKEKLVGAAVV